MSRFFKFKTGADLLAASGPLGLDLRLAEDDLSPLLQPLRIADRTIGNRMVIQPMEGCDGTADGTPDELTFRRYERFGAGGAKLIWGEAAAVVPEGRANTRQLVVDAAHADGLARLVQTCRQAHRAAWGDDSDLLIGLQLTHSGRYSVPRPILAHHDPLLDRRTIVDRSTGAVATANTPLLSDDELDRLLDRYVEAAGVAARAGFDFVDLKQCHRYLLNELLSATTRPGRYGGSFENRTRFITTLVDRIRQEHPTLLIGTRLNVHDGLPFHTGPEGTGVPDAHTTPTVGLWGTNCDQPDQADLTEPIQLIGRLRELGVALVNVTLGNPYANPHLLRPFEYAPPDAYATPEHPLIGVDRHFRLAAQVQQAFPDFPVVGSGYSYLQRFQLAAGAANVRDGRVSLVGIGRGSLSYPDFARTVVDGTALDPKKVCRTFSDCTALMRAKHHALGQFPTGCPPFDKEVYGPIFKEMEATAPPRG